MNEYIIIDRINIGKPLGEIRAIEMRTDKVLPENGIDWDEVGKIWQPPTNLVVFDKAEYEAKYNSGK